MFAIAKNKTRLMKHIIAMILEFDIFEKMPSDS
jgi:hypothetical protein